MKKLRAFLNSRSYNIIISIILSIALFICLQIFVSPYAYPLFCIACTVLFFMYLVFKNRSSKTNFIILCLCITIPIFALTIWAYSSNVRGNKRTRIKWKELTNLETTYTVEQNNEVLDALSKKSATMNKTARYLNATLNAPVFENNSAYFINTGEKYFEEVAKSLKQAKKYIFIECSKMQDCQVWKNIFQLLKEKAFVGVEIKLLYDDYHSIKAFKDKFTFAKLFNHKIETKAFNPLNMGVGKLSTYRNENNTIIIDGEVAYSGQIGLDDAFVDKVSIGEAPHTKIASAVCITGEAVISLTKNFVTNWNLFADSNSMVLEKYLPKSFPRVRNKNYIQPFEINPLIKEPVCKNIQNNIINCANQSLWIVTPYLLIGSESCNSLIASARCGVDVNIIVCKNYKSAWKNNLSYTNYGTLIKEGIKIYTIDSTELETQIILADSSSLLIGAGNLDSRKMYSPFQTGILIYSEEIASSAKASIDAIMPYCTQLTYKTIKKRKLVKKLKGSLLKIFSPIM